MGALLLVVVAYLQQKRCLVLGRHRRRRKLPTTFPFLNLLSLRLFKLLVAAHSRQPASPPPHQKSRYQVQILLPLRYWHGRQNLRQVLVGTPATANRIKENHRRQGMTTLTTVNHAQEGQPSSRVPELRMRKPWQKPAHPISPQKLLVGNPRGAGNRPLNHLCESQDQP